MLSCSKIPTNTKSAHSYYSADNYYSQNSQGNNDESVNITSFWHGKLADDLGLKGSVDGTILDNFTNGILPNGIMMQGRVNEKQQEIHDSGRDLTFSAPKSVSILSEVLDIDVIRDAHAKAVKNSLDYIEENYSYTRIKANGVTRKELTNNLAFGTYAGFPGLKYF